MAGSGVVEPQAIHGDERRSLKLAPPATARFRVRVPARGALAFGLAARPVGVPLTLTVEAGGVRLHEERGPTVAPWSERRVDLSRVAGRDVEIRIHAEGRADLVALGEPKLLAPRPAPDNVLVYVVDCLRADRLGAMGYARGTTPHIDALAGQAAVFERAYACAAWTKPSVGCLFTGLYSIRHGARSADHALDPAHATLAESLRRRGYATAAVVANPVLDGRGFGYSRGFDSYLELAREWKGRVVNSTPADAAQVTEAALLWLRGNRDRPFFLYLHSIDLHYPYLAREGFESLVRPDRGGLEHDSDLYDSELAYNDREVGRLLAGLQDLGLAERTTVVLTADHGEEFGEHGSSRHGRSVFDTLLHVPLVVKPAGWREGRRIGGAVANIDVMPTLLDLVGAPAAPGLDGVSLRATLQGSPPPERPLFAEQVEGGSVIYAVRHGRFKLVHELLPEPRQMLFDVARDPAELRDVSSARPEEAARQARTLHPFLVAGQEGLHLVLPDPPAGRTLRVELRSAARLAQVLRLVRRTGDTVEVAIDGRTARLAVVPGGGARHVVVRTEPAGAAVTIDLSGVPGLGLRLGDGSRVAESLPATLVPAELRVAASPPIDGRDGRAWAFALVGRGPEGIRAELQEQMRALGYLQ